MFVKGPFSRAVQPFPPDPGLCLPHPPMQMSLEIQQRMEEFSVPFLICHGTMDGYTDIEGSRCCMLSPRLCTLSPQWDPEVVLFISWIFVCGVCIPEASNRLCMCDFSLSLFFCAHCLLHFLSFSLFFSFSLSPSLSVSVSVSVCVCLCVPVCVSVSVSVSVSSSCITTERCLQKQMSLRSTGV